MDNVFSTHGDHTAFDMRRKASFSKLTGALPRDISGMHGRDYDPQGNPGREKIWKLMETYLATDTHSIQRSIVNHVEYTLSRTRFNFDNECAYRATAFSIRDRLIETLNDTTSFFYEKDPKRCYYLSLEFLVGRAMQNALVNLDIEENYKKALSDLGMSLETLEEYEHDAALGNGGLGRLAACFLDSMATLNFPCWGYGIRYTYGIFEQKIVNGRQVERPDYWLVQDNPWEIARHDITYAVRFYGNVKEYVDPNTQQRRCKWVDGEIVQAMAYDNPIPGFDTYNCINLRLFRAIPSREFDFTSFNEGRYLDAIVERQRAENISAVLYPNDIPELGKELRLKQQYFFVCATLQDVLRRFKKYDNRDWRDLPKKVTMQLNDTHPTIAIPELMRILIDIEGLEYKFAWELTKQVFNYTNHTVLPEAQERWSAALIERLLPRHLLIINDINFHFMNEIQAVYPNDWDRMSRMSIYQEGDQKSIRMAYLAVVGSNKVNGVAAIHSEIVRNSLFPDFVEFFAKKGIANKFLNCTNGVTPRRWIHCANRPLSNLISNYIGSDSWLKELDLSRGLMNHLSDPDLHKEWADVKYQNKCRLAKWVEINCGVKLNPEIQLFDIQVKRIHEYKRQLMNCLYLIHRYLKIKRMSPAERKAAVPRAVLIGGKAAPGYKVAKTIIKLASNIGAVVNNDPDVGDYMKVVFLPNYNVSNAQIIIPGSDLSQHISMAGTEASGTSNMKFVMNGGLIIGTLDGANVEIREECGEETMFIFGARVHEIDQIKSRARNGDYPVDGRLSEVFEFIRGGNLMLGDESAQHEFAELINNLVNNGNGYCGDNYLILNDFADYVRAQAEVDKSYSNPAAWWSLSIQAASCMSKFSSDRTIRDYATHIWDLAPAERPAPEDNVLVRMRSFANDPKPVPAASAKKTAAASPPRTANGATAAK
eukprot:Lankesteria_metandrocarpae@DN3425_c0_g1_i1.p1